MALPDLPLDVYRRIIELAAEPMHPQAYTRDWATLAVLCLVSHSLIPFARKELCSSIVISNKRQLSALWGIIEGDALLTPKIDSLAVLAIGSPRKRHPVRELIALLERIQTTLRRLALHYEYSKDTNPHPSCWRAVCSMQRLEECAFIGNPVDAFNPTLQNVSHLKRLATSRYIQFGRRHDLLSDCMCLPVGGSLPQISFVVSTTLEHLFDPTAQQAQISAFANFIDNNRSIERCIFIHPNKSTAPHVDLARLRSRTWGDFDCSAEVVGLPGEEDCDWTQAESAMMRLVVDGTLWEQRGTSLSS